ncbi:MAG: permease, partial [Brevibacterium aurantiacum]
VGASALIGRWIKGRAEVVPEQSLEPTTFSALPVRYLRSLSKFTLILVPEHLALVFIVGLISPWLSGVYGLEAQVGGFAVLIAALVGTLLVIPTGGEIPIILALSAVGVGAGVTGALLIVLPALSIPSMVMVGKSLGWRTTTAMGTAVALGGVLSGAVLVLGS